MCFTFNVVSNIMVEFLAHNHMLVLTNNRHLLKTPENAAFPQINFGPSSALHLELTAQATVSCTS